MATPRVSIPVTPSLSWVLPVPEHWLGAARAASPAALRELEAAFAPPVCPGCPSEARRLLAALSVALDQAGDDAEPGDDAPADPTD